MIHSFQVNPLGEICYVVSTESGEAAIIDCGAYTTSEKQAIGDYIRQHGLTLRYVWQTHSHFDHLLGLPYIYREFGIAPMLHRAEKPWYDRAEELCILGLGEGFREAMPQPARLLDDGDELPLAGLTFTVLHTPGHTAGGCCFYCPEERILFSGDTLFCESVGRSDLPGGNPSALISAIREKLLTLPDDVTVYPGHGRPTNIAHERRWNPYI